MSEDQLCVNENVSTEDDGNHQAIDQLRCACVWEPDVQEPKEDQTPQHSAHIWYPGCEVVLCLASKQREEHEDASCEDQGLQDNLCVVLHTRSAPALPNYNKISPNGGQTHKRSNDRYTVCFQARECPQEQQIGRIALSLPERQEQESDCTKHACPHHPLIFLDPVSVARRPEGHGAQRHSEQQLGCEDCIDLSHKHISHAQRLFVDREVELHDMVSKRCLDGVAVMICSP